MMKWIPLLVLLLAACGCDTHTKNDAGVAGTAPVLDSTARAIAALNDRIVSDPDNPVLYAERARAYLAQDSIRKAIKDLERSVGLDSSNVVNLLTLGDLYYGAVQVDNAQRCFQHASSVDPSNTKAILKLAEIQLVLRNYKVAMAKVNDALRIDPNAAHGYYLKGWIHMETHDTALAISSFRTAIEQDPQDYNTYVMLGKLSAAKHDPLAEQYYNTALELRPTSVEALYNKGVYLQDNGRDSLALECYARIMAIDTMNSMAWYNSGWVRLEHLNDPERAKRDLDRVIELQPNLADAWYNRGVAMERTDQVDSAAANYQVCLSIVPTHALAIAGLDRLASRGVRIKMREKRKPN